MLHRNLANYLTNSSQPIQTTEPNQTRNKCHFQRNRTTFWNRGNMPSEHIKIILSLNIRSFMPKHSVSYSKTEMHAGNIEMIAEIQK